MSNMTMVSEFRSTKAALEAALINMGCSEPLPRKGRCLWFVPPGGAAFCITKTSDKSEDKSPIYNVACWRSA